MDQHYIDALIELHHGLEREGPGDTALARRILANLPPLPPNPHIVDLGCGSGAGALLLAAHYDAPVTAVDLAQPFLNTLTERARDQQLADRIHPLQCDFANLPFAPGGIDLLWSEGAAYNLTFAGALETWRPFLAPNALAVISELTWFADDIPDVLRRHWETAYPAIANEAAHTTSAAAAGFRLLATHRLPAQAWWDSYYTPVLARIAGIHTPNATMHAVIEEMQTEIDLFRRYSAFYGYTFYVLTAASTA